MGRWTLLFLMLAGCGEHPGETVAPPLIADPVSAEAPSHVEETLDLPDAGAGWRYTTTEDPMTGHDSTVAQIESTEPLYLSSPYDRPQRARLTIRNHASLGRGVLFGVEIGQLHCASPCSMLIRFDDEEPSRWSMARAGGGASDVLFVEEFDRFVDALGHASRVRFQAEFYRDGVRVVEFATVDYDHARVESLAALNARLRARTQRANERNERVRALEEREEMFRAFNAPRPAIPIAPVSTQPPPSSAANRVLP